MTTFSIVTADYLKEYCGKDKKGNPIFKEREIPHRGKRYKKFVNAVWVAICLNQEGNMVKVVETLI